MTQTDLTKELPVSTLVLAASGIAVLASCVLLAAAYYAETHRAPDQS